MNCPHCASTTTKEQTQKTALGYRTFRCSVCKHLFNERTGLIAALLCALPALAFVAGCSKQQEEPAKPAQPDAAHAEHSAPGGRVEPRVAGRRRSDDGDLRIRKAPGQLEHPHLDTAPRRGVVPRQEQDLHLIARLPSASRKACAHSSRQSSVQTVCP